MSELFGDDEVVDRLEGNSNRVATSRLTDLDVQSFLASDVIEPHEMTRVRGLGLTGRAYFRYLKTLGVQSERSMSQLAACGVSSYTYESFLDIGVFDVPMVCRLHLGGWTADHYKALLVDLRETMGRALSERVLSCHPAPATTLLYVKSSVKFADWILCLSERELGAVVAKCEQDEPGIGFFFAEYDF